MTWARPSREMAPTMAAAACSAAFPAISALVSKTRISIAQSPGAARARPDQHLQPLLGHQAMVGLGHVDLVEAEEPGPIGRGGKHLADLDHGDARVLRDRRPSFWSFAGSAASGSWTSSKTSTRAPAAVRPSPIFLKVGQVLVGAIQDHEQDDVRLPGHRVREEVLVGARRGEPPALELPELDLGVLRPRTSR